MEPPREIGKLLVVAGILLAAAGAVLMVSGRPPFRFGRLPGDISVHGKHGNFYFPVVTCIVLSVAFTLILWIVALFRR